MEKQFIEVLVEARESLDASEIYPFSKTAILKAHFYSDIDENGNDNSYIKMVVGQGEYKSFPVRKFSILKFCK